MASASFIAACCLGNRSIIINSDIPPEHALLEETVVSIITLIVSVASFIGTIALSLARESRQGTSLRQNIIQGRDVRHVSNCLIATGLVANVGLIVRSSVWLGNDYPPPDDNHFQDGKHIFCVISTVWVQYCFLSVIFWHLVYGLETFLASNCNTSPPCLHYVIGWIVPAALCVLAACIAYEPRLDKCGAKQDVNRALIYVIFLLPIVIVVMLISALFYKSLNNVKRSLIRHFGRFSTHERELLDNVSNKFIVVTAAFIVCWIPNVVNGILVSVVDENYRQLMLVLIVLECVLNPFQVLIDSMVMFEWTPKDCCSILRSHRHDNTNFANINNLQTSVSSRVRSRPRETDPLLSFSRRQSDMSDCTI